MMRSERFNVGWVGVIVCEIRFCDVERIFLWMRSDERNGRDRTGLQVIRL